MFRLLQWLLFGHIHHWETIAEKILVGNLTGKNIGMVFHERCTKCGVNRLNCQNTL